MTQPTGDKASLSSAQALELLDLLATDDDFRSAFQKDPVDALRKQGLPVSGTGACLATQSLAPKEEIELAKAALAKHLISSAALQNPHCFEAGQVQSYLRATD